MDWKKIVKEYRRLKCPPGYYDPTTAPLGQARYYDIVTERATGKTTNVLLLGLCANKACGTVVQYIRQTDTMLAPKNASNLCANIISNGYVSKLTDGRYNTMIYKSRRWYYASAIDGEITETAPEACIVCLSIDNNEVYKSSYNAPQGDYIIFDEFCARRHIENEFVRFCDLLSTIIRTRNSGVVWMLGNMIDRYDYYFDEMEISDYMRYMGIGDNMLVTTSKGTPIYIEIFAPHAMTLKERVNKAFFGFTNPGLNAITGEGWIIEPCPHIERDAERRTLDSTHHLLYEGYDLQLDICASPAHGLHICAHKCTTDNKPQAVYYTLDDMLDIRYRYKLGHTKIDRLIWTLYDRNLFFYGTNSDAAILRKYLDRAGC